MLSFSVQPGTLYIVPTPIGNLADITLRALETLKRVDVIAAEDTRHAKKLLQAHHIDATLLSYHDHNELARSQELVARLKEGATVALVSDAGTPTVADPGYRLIQECLSQGIAIVPLPGPCAAITALSAAGLPTDRFYFLGFLPVKSGKRRQLLASCAELPTTLVFYESPYRLLKSLREIAALFPERQVVVARELTKRFEEFCRGTAEELIAFFEQKNVKGEIVLLIQGKVRAAGHSSCHSPDPMQ